jgi:hypothetical protein
MKIDDLLASQLAYGGFTLDDEIYLRGRGPTVAFEFRACPLRPRHPLSFGLLAIA